MTLLLEFSAVKKSSKQMEGGELAWQMAGSL